MPDTTRNTALIAAAVIAVVTLSYTPAAHAIPAFARRYETSCQTCHTTFPALTPFGEAFRRNGYRFPGGQDEDRQRQDPVELGQEIHERLFPDEVWPGELPGTLPIAIRVTPMMMFRRAGGGDPHGGLSPSVLRSAPSTEDYGVSFGGSSLAVLLAGTLGQNISFFAKLEVNAEGEVELERPFITIYPFDEPLLSFRIGMFEPSLYPFSIHRNLAGHDLSFTAVTLGDNAWAPEPQQMGIEATGILFHRLGYTVGVVEGAGDLESDKDFYARLEYKIGGMSLDGIESTGRSSPWQELSLQVGASVYRGVGLFVDPLGSDQRQTDEFWRISGDLQAHIDDVSLTFAAFSQFNQRPLWANAESGSLYGFYSEASWVLFPWLIPMVRYEMYREELPGMQGLFGHRFTASVNALIRANVSLRAVAEGRIDGEQDAQFSSVSLALSAAF